MVLNRLRGRPFPVSATSIHALRSERPVVTVMEPSASMASTAFLMRFSITHWKSESDRSTISGPWQQSTVRCMRDEMRVDIYDAASLTTVLRLAGSSVGFEPTFPNREAMVERRVTSLFISFTMSASTPSDSRSSIHAMSDEMGVPS